MSTTTGDAGSGSSAGVKELKTAQDVVGFWFGDPERLAFDKDYEKSLNGKWFGFGPKDDAFIETQMAAKDLAEKAARGELAGEEWEGPQGCLARLLLLDQFPRTIYRGTAQAFAGDEIAASLSMDVISKRWDVLGAHYTFAQRMFVNMPLMHSERLEAQDICMERSIQLLKDQAAAEGKAESEEADFAREHRDVIVKFGRFPHRNAALGRESTAEELEWLQSDDVPNWASSQAASPAPSP